MEVVVDNLLEICTGLHDNISSITLLIFIQIPSKQNMKSIS